MPDALLYSTMGLVVTNPATTLYFQVGEPVTQLHNQACRCRLRLHLWAEQTVWGAEPVVVERNGDAHTPPDTAESGRWRECALG